MRRDLVTLVVGILLGATTTSVMSVRDVYKSRRELANTIPTEQCFDAILAASKRF